MKLPALPALLAALLVTSTLTFTSAQAAVADEPTTTVTWPEVTRFNPAVTPYVVHIADSTQGATYRAPLVGGRYLGGLSAPGDLALTFPDNVQGAAQVYLERCVSTGCQTISTSPLLEVRSRLSFDRTTFSRMGPHAANSVRIVSVWPFSEPLAVTWTMSKEGSGAVQASGGTVVDVSDRSAVFGLEITDELATGNYRVTLDYAADLADFGQLAGQTAGLRVFWSASPPQGTVELSSPVVYPFPDGYRDKVTISADFRTRVQTAVLELLDSDGVVLRTFRENGHQRWDGTNEAGDAMPPGRYTVRLLMTDHSNNTAEVRRPVRLSNRRIRWRTFRHTYPAADTVIDTAVGSCSKLAEPSSRGWNGSLGYFSQTSCTRAKQSHVVTLNGVYVPKSLKSYRGFSVSVFGGAARGSSSAYAILGYVRALRSAFVAPRQLSGSLGRHAGETYPGARIVKHRTSRPYVLWQLGLSEGSRYDVKSFTVSLVYATLGSAQGDRKRVSRRTPSGPPAPVHAISGAATRSR